MSGPLPKEAPVLPPLPESVNETFKILENNPVVKDALKQIKEEEQLTMADQIDARDLGDDLAAFFDIYHIAYANVQQEIGRAHV